MIEYRWADLLASLAAVGDLPAGTSDRALMYALLIMAIALGPMLVLATMLALWYRYLWHITTDVLLFGIVAVFCTVFSGVAAYFVLLAVL